MPGCGEYSRKQFDALTEFVKRPQVGACGRDGNLRLRDKDHGNRGAGPPSFGREPAEAHPCRQLASRPAIIVASQPTRGLDVGAALFVRERLLERRAAGTAILLLSSDLEEILALSDRIAVMHRGTLSDPVENGPGVDMTRIGLLMAGHRAGESR